MNRTWKFVFVVLAIAMITPSSALAQKSGDDSTTSTCEPTPWLVFANGDNPSDIGSATTLASKNSEGESLYVMKDRVPQPVQDYLEGSLALPPKGGQITTYVIGGEDAISEEVVDQLQNSAPLEVIRLQGESRHGRYGTNVAVAGTEPPCRVVTSDEEGTVGK